MGAWDLPLGGSDPSGALRSFPAALTSAPSHLLPALGFPRKFSVQAPICAWDKTGAASPGGSEELPSGKPRLRLTPCTVQDARLHPFARQKGSLQPRAVSSHRFALGTAATQLGSPGALRLVGTHLRTRQALFVPLPASRLPY